MRKTDLKEKFMKATPHALWIVPSLALAAGLAFVLATDKPGKHTKIDSPASTSSMPVVIPMYNGSILVFPTQ